MNREYTPLITSYAKEVLSKWQNGELSTGEVRRIESDYAFRWMVHRREEDHDVWYDLWTVDCEYLPEEVEE